MWAEQNNTGAPYDDDDDDGLNNAMEYVLGKSSNDLNRNGKTKNLKHAAVEIGLPGKPKKHILLLSFANNNGFPGLIETPLKKLFKLNCLIKSGMKSNFPADTAPEERTKSVFNLIFFLISFLKEFKSLSLKILLTLKLIGKFLINDAR